MKPESRTGHPDPDVRSWVEDDIERLRAEQDDAEEAGPEREHIVEDLEVLRDEMRAGHDPTTAREAFEQEAAELDVSEEAGEVGDET